jgi:DNA adenine methylase Dam
MSTENKSFNNEWLSKKFSNPFNWVGSKHRYLKDLFDLLPSAEGLKVLDPFVGGGDLISKLNTSWSVDAGDCMPEVIALHNAIKENKLTPETIAVEYNKRGMSKENREAFLKLRDEYNKTKKIELLYLLMTNSFNNQLRFNKKGGFNMPFGKGRSSFNPNMKAKLNNYQNSLKGKGVNFINQSYKEFNFLNYDLLLIDPPYLNTTATYNESTGWSKSDDLELFNKLDQASEKGVKFIYFNQIWSKGVRNDGLADWSKKYNVRILKETSSNCSSNRVNGATEEVMIWN